MNRDNLGCISGFNFHHQIKKTEIHMFYTGYAIMKDEQKKGGVISYHKHLWGGPTKSWFSINVF
jgi:hypothetical protein